MMILKKLIIVFSIFISVSYSQIFSDIPFDLDYAVFDAPGNKLYLETYLLIPVSLFESLETANGREINGIVRIVVFKDSIVAGIDKFSINDVVKSEPGNETLKIPQMSVFELGPGNYTLRVDIKDEVAQKTINRTIECVLNDFSKDNLCLSDIQLASVIQKSDDSESIFYKYGLQIIPNASNIFTLQSPMLFPFLEIYNIPVKSDYYSIEYVIYNPEGEKVLSRGPFDKKRIGPTVVEYTALNVAGLHSGKYTIRVKVNDKNSDMSVFRDNPFYVYRQGERLVIDNDVGSELAGFSDDDLNDYYEIILFISTKNEKKLYSANNRSEKEKAIKQFFKFRDPNPPVSGNRFKRIIDERIKIVNEKYSSTGWEGWKSDQGRYYIKYGKPDEMEEYPAGSPDYDNPYEIWYYHSLAGGAQFLFIDLQGFGKYLLVHSTHPNEVQNYQWQYLLQDVPSVDVIKY